MATKANISVPVLSLQDRKKVEEVALDAYLFDTLVDHGEVYLAVRALESQSKSKPGYTKSRGQITGSNKKMYRQKGTGRARHSTSKAPQFVGGGRAHGPKGLKSQLKVNKKVWRKAMQLLLSNKIADQKILVFDALGMEQRSTKQALGLFPELNKKVTFVGFGDLNLAYSVRNLPKANYCDVDFANVLHLAHSEHMVFSKTSFLRFMERLQKTVSRGVKE